MGLTMQPHHLTSLLRRASERFHVAHAADNPYPEGFVYYKHGRKEVQCGACEHGTMDYETHMEKDELNPYKETYTRRSWPHVLRNIYANEGVPLDVRRRLYALAQKEGYRGVLNLSVPHHRPTWLQMRGL
jgi:hypothetical protein